MKRISRIFKKDTEEDVQKLRQSALMMNENDEKAKELRSKLHNQEAKKVMVRKVRARKKEYL